MLVPARDRLSASKIASWDGAAWSAVGGGVDQHVLALAVHDDGSGAALHAGGLFTMAGGFSFSGSYGIASWNGTGWTALGGGVTGTVIALASVYEGSGPVLYAGGEFSAAGGSPASRIARWDGTSWSALGSGLSSSARTLAAYDDGTGGGRDLYVGGWFASAGDVPSLRIAEWLGCDPVGEAFCAGDGSTRDCPCSNLGAAGRGCDNSAATGGARAIASGNASLAADTLSVTSTGELPTALTILLQGDLEIAPVVFGDGLRCAGGNLERLFVTGAVGGSVVLPPAGEASISARSSQLGDPLSAGAVRVYQAYYRDASSQFCPAPQGNTWNASNALRIAWGS
ncbi:MAG: hypothetical protein M3N56_14740 [Actinomycetota bacterium]|nr:hypothetical protein [Actinomycetota bacterium]